LEWNADIEIPEKDKKKPPAKGKIEEE